MDKKSPINTVSQHTKIYDGAFVYHMSPIKIVRKRSMLLKQLNIRDVHELRKLTSMMLAYSGDYQRAAEIMKPSISRPASIDLLIFNLLLQSSVLKTHSKNFLYLKSML